MFKGGYRLAWRDRDDERGDRHVARGEAPLQQPERRSMVSGPRSGFGTGIHHARTQHAVGRPHKLHRDRGVLPARRPWPRASGAPPPDRDIGRARSAGYPLGRRAARRADDAHLTPRRPRVSDRVPAGDRLIQTSRLETLGLTPLKPVEEFSLTRITSRRSSSARCRIELRRNRVKDGLQRAAERGQSRDQTDGDESGDQAVLDRGGAGLVLRENLKDLQHLNGSPSDLAAGDNEGATTVIPP